MSIKASDVKKLRDKTGAGMMDCKSALEETGGDFQKAEKKLKELGLAAAAKRSGRATNNGRIMTRIAEDQAGILELACETDFVGRNKDFIALGEALLDRVFTDKIESVNDTLETMVKDLISTIKENMALKRFKVMSIDSDELVAEYIHGEGTIGVLVKIKAGNPAVLSLTAVKEFLFDCALHIAAFNPAFLSKELVSADYLEEQKDIFTKQVAAMGKPANVVENIAAGKLNKHYAEVCFLQQPFVKDDKRSVEQVLADLSKQVGSPLAVTDFAYYRVGEEI